MLKEIYQYAYFPWLGRLASGLNRRLPRVLPSTKGEGHERTILLRLGVGGECRPAGARIALVWLQKPNDKGRETCRLPGHSGPMGILAYFGRLPRTAPMCRANWLFRIDTHLVISQSL